MEHVSQKKSGIFFKVLIIIIGVVSVVLITTLFTYAYDQKNEPIEVAQPLPSIIDLTPKEYPVSLVFVGDIMFDRGVETSVKNNFGGDFSLLFENVDFADADIVFGNLEGPVSDKGKNVGSKWSFRMDPSVIDVMMDAGFDIVSFANNHVGDWSTPAFEDTLTRMEESGMRYTGAGWTKEKASAPTIFDIQGTKIGFLGFTDVGPEWLEAQETTPGILLASDPNFEAIIATADKEVDILVTSFHWGVEYMPHTERQSTLAHTAIDAGADLVIGHHPHVIQATEWYNNKLIAYSLGNFIFDQYFSNETMQGLVLQVIIEKNEIKNVENKIVELDRRYQPQSLRNFEDTDVVTKRVSTSSLCPTISKWFPDQSLFNVTGQNSLGTYEPQELTHMNNRIDARGTATCLTPETGDAVEAMLNAAREEGLQLIMTSGYRSYAIQEILYEKNQKEYPDALYPSVAKPGHSEHQLGTTVDVKSLSTEELTYSAFGASPEYQWLAQNAHRYGFVQSYPIGKEAITGYIPEPWHWRYVGVSLAEKIRNSGLTVTEYLEKNAI